MSVNHMLRLVFVVLCLGAVCASLVSLRHQRLQAAHELARSHERVRTAEARLSEERARLARAASLGHALEMAAALEREVGPLVPESEARADVVWGEGPAVIGSGGEEGPSEGGEDGAGG